MLQTVDVGEHSLEAYRSLVSDSLLEALVEQAEPLRGARILHVSATPYGGGVSELLRSVVPLQRGLGLDADWQVIAGDSSFFEVTKTIHNGLQGATEHIGDYERMVYAKTSEQNAERMGADYDFVFVHDPQPAALLQMHGKGKAHWIWRCHIDTSEPNPEVWEFVRGFLADYDAAIFTMPEFVPPGQPVQREEVIPPAIDPLSPKNLDLSDSTAREVIDWIGVNPDQPLLTQVARFDPWKDPMGVISAYRMVREHIPQLQLALVGSMALDDPEGWDIYRQITAESASDPLIHVFSNLTGVGNIEVNAFQRLSDVIVQKSTREGFGLVVSEAMWKGTPVVAGRAGGISLQMADGAGGALVETVEDCAKQVLEMIENPAWADHLGDLGKERVREHFLIPRLVVNELSLMQDIASEGRPAARAPSIKRDPFCGMALAKTQAITDSTDGGEVSFCSRACRERFYSQHSHLSKHLIEPGGGHDV
jgi:trehalose synthase